MNREDYDAGFCIGGARRQLQSLSALIRNTATMIKILAALRRVQDVTVYGQGRKGSNLVRSSRRMALAILQDAMRAAICCPPRRLSRRPAGNSGNFLAAIGKRALAIRSPFHAHWGPAPNGVAIASPIYWRWMCALLSPGRRRPSWLASAAAEELGQQGPICRANFQSGQCERTCRRQRA